MTIEFDGQNNKLGTTTADSVTIKTNDTDAITVDSSQNTTLAGNLTVDTNTLYVDSANNRVGVGTSSPQKPLHVAGTGEQLRIQDNTNSGSNADIQLALYDSSSTRLGYISKFSSDFYIVNQENADTIFYTNNLERMRIDSSGNVLLGKTSSGAGNRGVEFTNLSSANPRQTITSTGTGAETKIEFRNGNGYVGEIFTNGSGTTYLTSSDYRLKENVVDLDDATTRVKQLQPKRFNFIANADTTVDGFLAHEVSDIVPEAIKGTKDEVEVWKEGEELPEGVSVGDNKLDDEGNTIPVYQGIDQSKLVPLLTASLQEAIAKIEELETRLEALENV